MSDTNSIIAELREDVGKGASRRLRRDGRVPAVIYGGRRDPVALTVDQDELLILEVTARSVPRWVHEKLFPPELRTACRSLHGAVRHVSQGRPASWEPTPCQIATLRTLIVHRWRRVVLRLPDLPDGFYPPDWTGPACRAQVFRLLDQLPRPLPDELNQD